MTIDIKKAKIKNRLFLSYEYTAKENDVENKISTSSDAPIHEDLQNAFDSLIPHLVSICEEEIIKSVDASEVERLHVKYSVTGVTIAGSEDSEGVVISGYKTLASEKVVNFSTPFQKYSDEDYPFTNDLYNSVETLKAEVLEYMDGKQAERMKVGVLDFGDDDDEAFSMGDVDNEEDSDNDIEDYEDVTSSE